MRDIPKDIAKIRNVLEQTTGKVFVIFFFIIALMGGLLFVLGMLGGGLDELKILDTIPHSLCRMILGMFCFSMFFPWFLCLYLCRGLWHSLKRLEKEVDTLREISNTSGEEASVKKSE